MVSYSQMREAAKEFLRQHTGERVLILSNERGAGDEITQEICGNVVVGVDRYAFRDFVRRVSRDHLGRTGAVPVSRIVREAIAARVAHTAPLTVLKDVARFPGFPRALAQTLERLRLDRQTPTGDLAALLAAYESELRERHFADHAMRVDVATAKVRSDDYRFRGRSVLLLDVAADTAAECELIEAVKTVAPAALDLHLDTASNGGSCLELLQRNLFSEEVIEPREGDGSVEIFSTSGEALECVEIARRIVQSGVPFDDCAILLRSPERYQPLVVEGLRRAGVPVYCSRGTIRPDAAGRAFVALLACAEEGLTASRFAEYLSLGQMREQDAWVSPAGWERLLVDAAVVGGKDRWERRLKGLQAESIQRYEDAEDEEARERCRWRIAQIEALEKYALPLIAKLDELPEAATWGEWIECLTDLAETTSKSPDRVVDFLAELQPMADIGPVPIGEVLLVLGPRLNTLRATDHDSRYGRVWVGGIEEARGMSFRRVFVPGVNEGLFPRPPSEDPLWPGEPQGDDHELLRVAAACASERFSLSFSRLDLLTGRERVPSFFAFEAWRASGGHEMDVREFEKRARVATGTKIGWPAPDDPALAIDDTEFDLATLAPRAEGSGQYLKKLSGRAVDSLRVRWARWHKSWKPADGLYVEEIGSDLMKRHSLRERSWAPSMLEQYALCPYRFALRGIFELREAERPGAIQRLDPATRGLIYHETQAELLKGSNWLERLDSVLGEVASKYEEQLAPAIPQIWQSEMRSLRADLRGWLEQKLAMEAEWSPLECEREFEIQLDEGFRLDGRIDLIERHASGVLRVVDHKTGKPRDPRPEMVGGGETLQPALYGLAVEKALGERVSTGRLWYATIARNYDIIDVPLNDWTRRRVLAVLERIDGAITGGFLPAAPRKDACKGCEYRVVCGPYEEERVADKSQVELSALRELRSWK